MIYYRKGINITEIEIVKVRLFNFNSKAHDFSDNSTAGCLFVVVVFLVVVVFYCQTSTVCQSASPHSPNLNKKLS